MMLSDAEASALPSGLPEDVTQIKGTIIGLMYFKGSSLSRYLKYITISISITHLPPPKCDNIFEIIHVSSFNV